MALAIGIFVLITVEELPIGVLSVMAPDLGVSEGMAGLAVTIPGILAGVVALCTPVLVRGMDRRLVLVLALASVVVSCGLSVVAACKGAQGREVRLWGGCRGVRVKPSEKDIGIE